MQQGLRFPLPKFASSFLTKNALVPFQLHSKGWANLMAFHILSFLKGVPPSLELFQCFFQVSKFGERAGIVTIKRRIPQLELFIDNVPSPLRKFERYWFIVTPPQEFWDALLGWCWQRKSTHEINLNDLRECYATKIAILTSGDKMPFTELVTSQNLLNAGWGIEPEPSSNPSCTSS